MKKFSLLFLLCLAVFIQAPAQTNPSQKIKTAVRNSKGQLVQNTAVSVKYEIVEHSANGAVLFAEVHQGKTKASGEVELVLGTGKTLVGDLATVTESTVDLFLKTYIDLNGGVSFMEMDPARKSQIPYALYAGCVEYNPSITPLAEVEKLPNENTIVDFDGNVYTTVKIGKQEWLAQNVKSVHYSDGTPINGAFDYENNTAYTEEYGKLYTWPATMNGNVSVNSGISTIQGVCPTGFHIPSESEWREMANHVTALKSLGGKQLKQSGNKHWETANGTNTTGFEAVGAGFLQMAGGRYGNLKKQSYFWTATQFSPENARILLIYDNGSATLNHNMKKTSGRSVRCVKD